MKPTRALTALLTIAAAGFACGPPPGPGKIETPRATPTGVEACIAEARARAAPDAASASAEGRRRLEIQIASCRFPAEPAKAALIGAVNADVARAASAFLAGTGTQAAYNDTARDRERKLLALLDNRARLEALA